MAETTREKKEKIQTLESIKKLQKVRVLVSVYRVNNKIVSALGIPTTTSKVVHRFKKDKIKVEDLFIFTTTIKNHLPYSKLDSYKAVIEQALNDKVAEITLPETVANKLQSMGTFIHEILNIEIELLS